MSKIAIRVWDKTIFERIANRHSFGNTVEFSIKEYDFNKHPRENKRTSH